MGPADSDRISRVLPYSGTGAPSQRVPVRGCHPLRPRLSSRLPVRAAKGTSPGPTTPRRPRPPRFGLLPFRSPLLGESIFLSPPAGTGMFRFPAFARLSAYAHSLRVGCPIRTPPDHFALADPRGVSPLAASFIASGSPGIHRAPFSVSLRSPARASPPARDPGGDLVPAVIPSTYYLNYIICFASRVLSW